MHAYLKQHAADALRMRAKPTLPAGRGSRAAIVAYACEIGTL